jgi:ribosomal subunit interface protein
MAITQAMQHAAEKKSDKIAQRFPHIARLSIFLEIIAKKKNDPKAATAQVATTLAGKQFVVKEHAVNLYTAMHDAVETLTEKLSMYKARLQARAKRGHHV